MFANESLHMSVEEYLMMEESAPVRHEYVDGQVFAMSGATRRHNIITGNVFAILHAELRGSPCRPYVEAVKARIQAANCFYYPDVMVACDVFDERSVYTEEPVLIVEVLSPSTAGIDRREKLVNYRLIPTLKEYVIIHQRRKIVELYRKNSEGYWSLFKFGAGHLLELQSLPKGTVMIEVDSIYEDAGSIGGKADLKVREESDDSYNWSEDELSDFEW
ncbi:MAG: Uma2 family endonuclease [Cyanobacteria bacterium]|nr:Uma2 family endonuclease [Cyanobacteriota bacterium]